VLADLSLELVPLPVAQLLDGAEDEAVLLLCVGLSLVGTVVDLHVKHTGHGPNQDTKQGGNDNVFKSGTMGAAQGRYHWTA
jgi:hypothetical protein